MARIPRAIDTELTLEWLRRNASGKGVQVAVVDSGIDPGHPDLNAPVVRSCVVHDPGTGLPRCEELPVSESTDTFGHGTAMAGIISSIAPDVELVSVKVLGPDNQGTGPALIAGLKWALDQGYKLINMSLATSKERFLVPLFRLCEQAYVQDSILVVSRRNWGGVGMPAQFTSVISVDLDDVDSSFHLRFNPKALVEFAARGRDVPVLQARGQRGTMTGTSYATPHVTGFCALMLSLYPDLLPYEVKSILRLMCLRQAAGEDLS